MSDIAIEIHALELSGFHGATAHERAEGQRFVFDLRLLVHDAGGRTDQLADTVDYTQVVACIREISDGRQFNLLEALAAAVADELMRRFPLSAARVRVRKPDVRLEAPVAYTAATVERHASGARP